ncbi:MAG: hypothetical protein AB7M05_02215 [Alphaproteobacteria bacterium]
MSARGNGVQPRADLADIASVYGFAYSGFFQFPIGQHTHQLPDGTPVNSWRVTVLPDP